MKRNEKRYEKLLFERSTEEHSKSIWKQFKSVSINLCPSEKVLDWSHGEVLSTETLSYRTLRSVPGGLHCESIFGPYMDWECACGKYQGKVYKGITCEECNVTIESSDARRERMGHITLEDPVLHTWYYTSPNGNPICQLLDISHKSLLNIAFYKQLIQIEDVKGIPGIHFITDEIYDTMSEEQRNSVYDGAEAITKALSILNLKSLLASIEGSITSAKTKASVIRRRAMVREWLSSNNHPTSMVIKHLPVLPAGLRPIVTLENGALGTSDMNILYRSVILRNSRLKRLKSVQMPRMILSHEKVLLQQAVDALIDNEKSPMPVTTKGPEKRVLKSLTDTLRGKKGILRMNLLGKRIDFSARSVIVVDPTLKLNQCGIPRSMALELYKPFLLHELTRKEIARNIREALMLIDKLSDKIWEPLEDVVARRPVLLNRAPTLHRQGIQAFDVVLVDGFAIRIHPLVCEGFNADFDGDQMAVYLCVLPTSALEAKALMSSVYNVFSHSNGRALVRPTREMLLGAFWISLLKEVDNPRMFISKEHAVAAWKNGNVIVNEAIQVNIDGNMLTSNVGRILLNDLLPQNLRNYNKVFDSKHFEYLITSIYDYGGFEILAKFLDKIKELGYEHATLAALSMSLSDMKTPESKPKIMETATLTVSELRQLYEKGKMTEIELRIRSMDVWNLAVEKVTKDLYESFSKFNDLFVTINSGARGNLLQARQLCACRGLISDANGVILSTPVLSSYVEGLQPFEYFMSSYGARKGIVDRTIKTANAGYLTRRLVDVAHAVFITEQDCKTEKYLEYGNIAVGSVNISSIERAWGRVLAKDIDVNDLHLKRNTMITKEHIRYMRQANANIMLPIRSAITCESGNLCVMCYGMDLSRRRLVDVGTAVGVIAAQSVGEPATQLTMRTFHTGGVASGATSSISITCNTSGFVSLEGITYKEWDNNALTFKGICTRSGYILIGKEKVYLELGNILCVCEGEEVKAGSVIARKEQFTTTYVAPSAGTINIPILSTERDTKGREYLKVPVGCESIIATIVDDNGKTTSSVSLSHSSIVTTPTGTKVKEGDIIAILVEDVRTADIVDDLSRIESILEMRENEHNAVVSQESGTATVRTDGNDILVYIGSREHKVDRNSKIVVKDGQFVRRGENITDGIPNFSSLFSDFADQEVAKLVLEHIQQIYMHSKIVLSEKHLEIITSQMFKIVKITNGGDSEVLPGEMMSMLDVQSHNAQLEKEGKKKICYAVVLSGISKVAASSSSFLSAASFQHTKKILAASAIKGAVDELYGIKENVIAGNSIPCGTALRGMESVENKKENVFYKLHLMFKLLEQKLSEDEGVLNNPNWIEQIISEVQ